MTVRRILRRTLERLIGEYYEMIEVPPGMRQDLAGKTHADFDLLKQEQDRIAHQIGDTRIEYERHLGSFCDTEEQVNALNRAGEVKKRGEAQTGQRVVTLVEGLNLSHLGSLRRQFSNPTPKLKLLIFRWKRGVYRVSQRAGNTSIQDVRGPCVRRIGKPQTFLTPAEVDRLIDDYLTGFSVGYLAQKYGVHRATVSKHLTRNNVLRRQHGLTSDEAAEAVKLYGGGISMWAIARTLGVNRKQVRVSLIAAGALEERSMVSAP